MSKSSIESETANNIKLQILLCNYATELELPDEVPYTEDIKELHIWIGKSLYVNKRNRLLRDSTSECITKVLNKY